MNISLKKQEFRLIKHECLFPLQVVLPMLCSYMSHWWEHGPESNPDRADSCCTSVTSEHMNTLLGNILKIIYNNLGIDEGAWMKRLAGKTAGDEREAETVSEY